jgi:tetratricopeptide (TPR) repeat protein
MSRTNESNLAKVEHARLLEEQIDILFEELSFAFQWQRPSILIAFYDSEYMLEEVSLALEKRLAEIGHQLMQIKVDENNFDIPQILSQRLDRETSVYSVSRLSSGGGKAGANAYRALNMRREYFVDYSIRAIIWLAGNEATELSRHAPDFWAFRHRVVQINDLSDDEALVLSELEPAEHARGALIVSEELNQQIEYHNKLFRNLPKGAGSYSKRLALLTTLAEYHQADGSYTVSIQHLKQAISIAKKLSDTRALAKLWRNLGSVRLDLDQFTGAVRAYRKASRINPQDADTWAGLGRVYQLDRRFSDAIIAYKQAIQVDPHNFTANASLVACYRQLGKEDHAKEQSQITLPIAENETEYGQAVYESVCGNSDRAIALLTKALAKKQIGLSRIRHDPNFDFIREDARYKGLTDPES